MSSDERGLALAMEIERLRAQRTTGALYGVLCAVAAVGWLVLFRVDSGTDLFDYLSWLGGASLLAAGAFTYVVSAAHAIVGLARRDAEADARLPRARVIGG